MSSSPKKYLSLEETAGRLSLSTEELIRMREQGEIRGFADRGTWKFRVEDVEEVLRSRQADSSPDVPMLDDEEDLGEQPTVIRKSDDVQKTSDSDVKLVSEEGTSDSDVKLVGDSESEILLGAEEGGSDSDVKLVGTDSDSEVVLGDDGGDSDSDVKLVGEPAPTGSDSDVQLIDTSGAMDKSSDSDVALVGGSDSAIALDLVDDSEQASVLSDDVGLAIENESSLTLAADSGISLEADSGITLEPEDGLVEAADSGITLESIGDSGISLEDSDEFSGTVPMMDAVPEAGDEEETRFEIPSMEDDDSAFELQTAEDSGDATGVLDLEDSSETMLDDAVFDLDEDDVDAFGEDELEVAPDILGEDDELDELEVFDADEGLFEESGVSQEFAAPVAGAVAVEQEWGAGLVAGLALSAAVMAFAAFISFDLVRSMWGGAAEIEPMTSFLFK